MFQQKDLLSFFWLYLPIKAKLRRLSPEHLMKTLREVHINQSAPFKISALLLLMLVNLMHSFWHKELGATLINRLSF
jgi:hypothetical protein